MILKQQNLVSFMVQAIRPALQSVGSIRNIAEARVRNPKIAVVVQKVTWTDELDLAASSKVANNTAFYFRSKRPPLMKDFFNAKLAKKTDIYALETRVEVEFKVKNTTARIKRQT